MTKIKDFLAQKIVNFKNFIDIQFDNLAICGLSIDESKISAIRNDFKVFESDINSFAQQINILKDMNIDDCVKLFLKKYDINIDTIKDNIDYDKLKKSIEMFINVLKNV